MSTVEDPPTHAEFQRLGRILYYLIMQVANPTLIQNLSDSWFRARNRDLRNRIPDLNQNKPHQEDPRGPKFTWVAARARQLAAAGHKVLIWTSFVHNVEGMAEELEDLNAVYIHGGVETDEFAGLSTDEIYDTNDESVGEEQTREDVIRRFKEDPSCWALVANPLPREKVSVCTTCAIMRFSWIGISMQRNSCKPLIEFIDTVSTTTGR